MKSEKGFFLIQAVIGLGLLGIIAVSFLSALDTGSKAAFMADERATAKNLAESQMENVKNQYYAVSYAPAPIPHEYTSYSVTIDAQPLRDGNIQKIRVTIWHHNEAVITLEGYKLNR